LDSGRVSDFARFANRAKGGVDWISHTTELASSAAKEFHAQKRNAS
jgi:hypothetical protein